MRYTHWGLRDINIQSILSLYGVDHEIVSVFVPMLIARIGRPLRGSD
jgi:hypothetical protein